MGWMRVEPEPLYAHPTEEDQSGSMNLPITFAERVKYYSLERPMRLASCQNQEQDQQQKNKAFSVLLDEYE
jgi:hypothetical protein